MIRTASNKDLSSLNTFGMKVRTARFIEYSAPEDLLKIDWSSLPQPVFQMGEGSNLLFTGDFPGTVMHSGIEGINVVEDKSEGNEVLVRVGAGVKFDEFCNWAAIKKLWGLENLSGIPGTVGASAVQNIGAYGVEAADVIDNVECFDIIEGKFVRFSNADCAFAYRDSFFKHNRGRYVVVYVTFHLTGEFSPQLDYANLKEEVERNVDILPSAVDPYEPVFQGIAGPSMPLSPMLVRNTVKIIRERKLPDPAKVGSAGSFFKNPVVPAELFSGVVQKASEIRGEAVTVPHYDLPDGSVKIPAAWLIEFCGFKGFTHGNAAIWHAQPLVLVNANGKATPGEILELEKMITDKISETFGIFLSPEVDHI